jgi:integrase
MVASGPRPTEVSALQRGNYDRATRQMAFLAEGVVRVKEQDQPERWEVATGETDKRRARVIELDPVVAADLDALLLEQDEAALACGVKLGRRAYLFSPATDCKTFLTPNTAGDGFAAAVERARAAGVDLPPGMRLYDMRHYGITYLLRAGAAPAAVAVRFATSEAMIRSRYSHAISGDDAHLAEKMAAVWAQPVTPGPVVSMEDRRPS